MNIFSVPFILAAFLIFVRVSTLILSAPYFGLTVFPPRIKLFFAVVLTVALYPIIPLQGTALPTDATFIEVLIAIIKEVLVGLSMGFVGQLIFGGVQLGGELISFDLGISFGSSVGPAIEGQSEIFSQLLVLIGIFLFLGFHGDTMYIKALAASFSIVPVGHSFPAHTAFDFLKMGIYLFKIGVQLASPFLVVLFFMDLSFAIFGRIMPQANIFYLELPVKVGVGFLIFLLIIPYLPVTFQHYFDDLWQYLANVLHTIGG